MNFFAKHYFDYQSFVNLPYKAVQLHKTPPSQAGVDPSAAWAPKSMQVAGKNLPAPGARACRNNVEMRPGTHRHGRPSKLEFREWGERHGELHPEKNVPHKDAWMVSLDGDFNHFHDPEEEHSSIPLPDIASKLQAVDDTNCQILVILTYAPQVEFVTVTVKKLRGFRDRQHTQIRVHLFDGGVLLEERQLAVKRLEGGSPAHRPVAVVAGGAMPVAGNHVHAAPIANHVPNHVATAPAPAPLPRVSGTRGALPRRRDVRRGGAEEEISESFLLHAAPHRLPHLNVVVQLFDGPSADELGELVGECVIGLSETSSRGIFHWRQMIRKQSTPVCMWHRLTKAVPKDAASK